MTSSDGESGARSPLGEALRPVIIIALAVTALRVLYLLLLCPYDLVEDEAQYWLWSQHIDWSYYSKGPGVAWMIGLSTWLLGNGEWAVRLPAAISGLVAMVAAAGLGAEAAIAAGAGRRGTRRAAMFALAAFALAPVFQMTALLMTIDGPLVASWLIAAWAAWRAMGRGSRSAWVVLGAAVAAGFLFKYTMLLILPGLIGFAIVRRRDLVLTAGWRVWACAGVLFALLGLVPVAVWNAQHDWDTVRHLLGHLGAAGGDMPVASVGQRKWSPWWSFELIGMQIGLAGPALLLGLMAAVRSRRGAMGPGASLLIWCAVPVLVFYLVVSFFAEPEGNWPIAGATTLLVLAGVWMSGASDTASPVAHGPVPPATRWFSRRRLVWNLAMIVGICAAPVLLRADMVANAATWALRMARPDAAAIRTGRLIGARVMGEHAARILAELDAARAAAADGSHQPAVVIVEHYGRASQLSYYLRDDRGGERTVYCASAAMGGRKSQFDLWPRTDLRDPALLGRDALLLSNDKPHTQEFWGSIFETVEMIPEVKLDGEHKRDRVAYIGRGYRGLSAREARP